MSITLLDIFKESSGQIPAEFVLTEAGVFEEIFNNLQPGYCRTDVLNQNTIFSYDKHVVYNIYHVFVCAQT